MATAAALLTWVLWDMYLGASQEADVPGGDQRHGRGPGRHHSLCRLRQRCRCPADRGHRLHHRVDGLDLPVAGQLHEEGSTTPWASSTPTGSPASSAVCCSGSSPTRPSSSTRRRRCEVRRHHGRPVRPPQAAAHPVPGGDHGHPLGRHRDLHHLDGDQMDDALAFARRCTTRSCEVGDLAVHDEEGYPEPEGATRVLPGYGEASRAGCERRSDRSGGAGGGA